MASLNAGTKFFIACALFFIVSAVVGVMYTFLETHNAAAGFTSVPFAIIYLVGGIRKTNAWLNRHAIFGDNPKG